MVVLLIVAKYFIISLLFLQGCATIGMPQSHGNCVDGVLCVRGPILEPSTTKQLINLPWPNQKTVVAVYAFPDLTGPSNQLPNPDFDKGPSLS